MRVIILINRKKISKPSERRAAYRLQAKPEPRKVQLVGSTDLRGKTAVVWHSLFYLLGALCNVRINSVFQTYLHIQGYEQ